MIWALVSGCVTSKDECDVHGKTAHDELNNAAPGAVVTVALAGCSTSAHSHVTGVWSVPATLATGTIEVQLSPQCPVQDTTVSAGPDSVTATADNNVKNCGDLVDYVGYVTNRTNVTLAMMNIEMVCPTIGE